MVDDDNNETVKCFKKKKIQSKNMFLLVIFNDEVVFLLACVF